MRRKGGLAVWPQRDFSVHGNGGRKADGDAALAGTPNWRAYVSDTCNDEDPSFHLWCGAEVMRTRVSDAWLLVSSVVS